MTENTAESPSALDLRKLSSGTALDEAVIAAIANATSENTRLNYRSQARRFAAWCHAHGVKVLPAEPADVARYLTSCFRAGSKIASIAAMRSAIAALHNSAGYPKPTDAEVVRRTVRGLSREAANTPRRRAKALTAEGFAAILATAKRPRRFGRRTESRQTADRRGADDAAIAALLFQGGLRRSEVAALTWGQIQPARTPDTVLVYLRGTKTDPTGNAADVRCLKHVGARAVLAIRPENPASHTRLFRLNAQSDRQADCRGGESRRHRGDHGSLRASRARVRTDPPRREHAGSHAGRRMALSRHGDPLRRWGRRRAGCCGQIPMKRRTRARCLWPGQLSVSIRFN